MPDVTRLSITTGLNASLLIDATFLNTLPITQYIMHNLLQCQPCGGYLLIRPALIHQVLDDFHVIPDKYGESVLYGSGAAAWLLNRS